MPTAPAATAPLSDAPAASALPPQDAGAAATSSASTRASSMRRVASAPAFKHASAYQAPSAAAAVAAAAADAAEAEHGQAATTSTNPHIGRAGSSSSSTSGGARASWFGRRRRSAACAPQPSCSSCAGGRCSCLEVYVVSRAFTEFGGPALKALPPDAREHMVDMGLCHYMTVFKTPDGQLVQFDFGPTGGDVQKAHGPLATLLRRAHQAALHARTAEQQCEAVAAAQAFVHAAAAAAAAGPAGDSRGMVHSPSAPVLPLASLDLLGEANEGATAAVQQRQPVRRKKGVAAEIRERQLEALPPACMYMGRTQLSLADIRRYNSAQVTMQYSLHEHDCRHYVNNLVQYATGVERSTQHLKRHYFQSRHVDKWLWYGWFISATQFVTDVGNWYNVQAGAAATLLAVTGRSTLAQLKTLATPALKALPSMIPAGAAAGGAAGGVGGGAVVAGLATTLKLPASLLLKRPLAGSAVAAAGGAGAAAAAIRTVPGAAFDGAAAAGGGSGSGAGGARGGVFGGFGAWGRPLKQWRDGLGHGFKGAVMSLRRAAVGNRDAATAPAVLRPAFAAVPGSAGAAVAALGGQQQRGWFGFARRPAQRQQLGYAVASSSAAVMVMPASAAASGGAATTAAGGGWGGGRTGRDGSGSGRSGGGFVAGIGHHVGRHVLWLGSTATKATGTIAVMAGRQVSSFVAGRPHSQAAAMASSPVGLMHSASSSSFPRQQQAAQRGFASQRSRSAPSLAVVAAAGAGARPCSGPGADGADSPVADGSDLILGGSSTAYGGQYDDLWGGSGSSSLTCSSVGGRQSGVGRQVLNLPAPRLSWGRRASNVVIRQ